ncbi:alpha/beta hydrolase [Robiginitalea sediminis]|uniref:alpha/beta hydrolase n=1 Tax=Robiginitalea sediminis TaxID=1982593 RepID=UPI000B4B5B56|nr:esterase [Robiginitalea sediminis]
MAENTHHSTHEKWVRYQNRAAYATLNRQGPDTHTVWVAFHGIGYLARYFLRHFKTLPRERHYLIAPQAPSLYYLSETYTHVGACWLTREHTGEHMGNLLGYLDQVAQEEALEEAPSLCLMGYSQGVSVLCRWVAYGKRQCDTLVLYAGRVPEELGPSDFDHLPETTRVVLVYGTQDPYIPEENVPGLLERYRVLFGNRLQVLTFEGGHEMKEAVIEQIARIHGST